MSAFSDFLSVGSFWWGTGVGTVIAGTLGPVITAKSIKSSDKRKAAQEDKVAERKFEQDKKLQRDQLTREACAEFLRVSTVAFNTATDTKGLFNIARDLHTAQTGRPDPLADEKIDFAETISAQTQTVAEAYSQLQMVAPREIVDKAIVLQTAVLAMLRVITQPMAKPVVANTVGEAIQEFVASVRKHLDRDELSNSTKEKAVMSYMDNLKRQVEEYLKDATADREASRRRR